MTDPKDLWPVAPLSEAAKARMIAHAVAAPQLLPWRQTITAVLERGLSEWRYGLVYKLAAAAACVALGLGIGVNARPSSGDIDGMGFAVAHMDHLEAGE